MRGCYSKDAGGRARIVRAGFWRARVKKMQPSRPGVATAAGVRAPPGGKRALHFAYQRSTIPTLASDVYCRGLVSTFGPRGRYDVLMLRGTLKPPTVISFILCLAWSVIWVRSYTVADDYFLIYTGDGSERVSSTLGITRGMASDMTPCPWKRRRSPRVIKARSGESTAR
jgi:hypothetical protein